MYVLAYKLGVTSEEGAVESDEPWEWLVVDRMDDKGFSPHKRKNRNKLRQFGLHFRTFYPVHKPTRRLLPTTQSLYLTRDPIHNPKHA